MENPILEERERRKQIFNGIYSSQARQIQDLIRNGVFGEEGNLQQNCIASKENIDLLANKAGIAKNDRVLDVCCGIGGISSYFAGKYGCQINGLDFCEAGIKAAEKLARAKGVNTRSVFEVCLAEEMPFEDGSFDIVYSFDSFHYVHDKQLMLNECLRVLKPGGKLVFYDWVYNGDISQRGKKLAELWGYMYVASYEEYNRYLNNLGLEAVEVIDNSKSFMDIISRWVKMILHYKDFLITNCGADYFDKTIGRWQLYKDLSQSSVLKQYLFVCRKPLNSLREQRRMRKNIFEVMYSAQARKLQGLIRDGVFGKAGNIGQNCILSKEDLELLTEKAAVNKDTKVLDSCCGVGGIATYIAKKYGCKMSGVDLSEAGIGFAKKTAEEKGIGPLCNFQVGLAEALPFRDQEFDLVCSFDSFNYVFDKSGLFRECFRVLRKGGKLAFYDWIYEGIPSEKLQLLRQLWGYMYIDSEEEYKKSLEKSGFDILEVTDNSGNFKDIISRWVEMILSLKDLLVKECSVDYFNKTIGRWELYRQLSHSRDLRQVLIICDKPKKS
ncbi:MAG: methyltransferase domain-containing protein [Candidatus Omnitrophica bacterium]|nr:methyltransferase domain-containing protein [Candidatus Omnitrophota bacterium]MDD5553794.1 methyltransferase domain-containing protein [Candidatus Omnitrophota bacterium]